MKEQIRRIVELSASSVQTKMYGLPQFLADTDPAEVARRFARADAGEFYGQFNPQDVMLDSFWGDMELYGFRSLEKKQEGYSVHGRDHSPIPDWPEGMLVIGDCGGDPIMLDPSEPGEILFAQHGMGVWEPLPIAADFEELLNLSIAWLGMVDQRGENLLDDTDELEDESFALFVQLARCLGIEQRYLDNMLDLA